MLNKTTPDLLLDLRSAGEAFEDKEQTGLSGEAPLGEAKTGVLRSPRCWFMGSMDVAEDKTGLDF